MQSGITFDDLENGSGHDGLAKKAFFELDLSNETDVLTWLNEELTALKSNAWQDLERTKNNYLRYKGIQYQNQVYVPRDVLETKKRYQPQMVVPFIRDAVDEKVSKLLEYKPTIYPMPTHDETKDKNDSKIAKRFIQHIDYTKNTDGLFRKYVRNTKIGGQSYMWVSWNPDLGDVLPASKELEGMVPKAEKVAGIVMQGDVQIKNKTKFFVFHPKMEWPDVDYCFVIEWEDVAKIKHDYPAKASDVVTEDKETYFDFESLSEKTTQNQCRKIYFYHKRTKYLPEGFEACFVKGALLKNGILSYDHGELPIVPMMDQENPDESMGESFIDHVRGLAASINNFINSGIKAMMLASHPKWFVQSGSIDEQQLNNDVGIVKVKSGTANPVLAQANPTSSQLAPWIETLKGLFYQMSKSNSIARGDLPEGVTAFVALQYVSESENRRTTTEVSLTHEAIRKTYDLILKTCGQFYKPNDKRTMQIMGKDGRWTLENYDVEAIAKPYNLILQNASGLPESKALRTQFIIDMNNSRPDLLPDQQVVEMLGIGQTEKYMDLASAAARAAEDEQELMLDGKGMIPPTEYEDSITHWRTHTMAIQEVNFKIKATPEVQQTIKDHILGTEYIMAEQAKVSPQYAAKLLMLPQFPMFLRDDELSQILAMVSGVGAAVQSSMPKPQPMPGGTPDNKPVPVPT